MILKDNLMYHNVDYIEETPLGDRFFRYPKELLGAINDHAREMVRCACNCEVRFVTDASKVTFRVTSLMGDGYVIVYRGDFFQKIFSISSGQTLCAEIPSPVVSNANITPEFFENNSFSKDVYRIHMKGFNCVFGGIDAMDYDVRPPKPEELPEKRIFAYGSSITQGSNAITSDLCYSQIAAKLLKADIENKGVAGSCYAEPEIADWYLTNPDWDVAILELGINMQDCMECDEIEKRYRYFMTKAAETGKPVFAPSMYRCYGNYFKDEERNKKYIQVDSMIRRLHSENSFPNIHFVDGEEMLPESAFLTADCIHPSTAGHFYMGTYLSNIMKKYM